MKHYQIEATWMSRKVLRHPLIAAFLRENGKDRKPIQAGWGGGPNADAACRIASLKQRPLLLLDDAFVRSMRPGKRQTVYGISADSSGSGYPDLIKALDSGSPTGWMRTDVLEPGKTAALLSRFREMGVSKYNWFPDEFREPPRPHKPGILVDMEEPGAELRLKAALDLSEGTAVYLYTHAGHSLPRRKLLDDARVHRLSPDLSPAQCFSFCHTVIVGRSLLGLEALIHEKKVITFETSFFSGRGLTEDLCTDMPSVHGGTIHLLELFETAYLRYCHYFDPDTKEPCELRDILDHIELQKEMFRKNRGHSVTVGFSPWNRSIASHYLRSPAGVLHHAKSISAIPPCDRALVWGRKTETPENIRNQTVRVEDGFIRSKGLGAAFNFPYSWVLDETGIYFDAAAPSDLENLYNKGFNASDLTESRELIRVLREKRLTKYNLTASKISLDKQLVRDRKIILVPGQVEADASILHGSPEVKSNLDLLLRVRAAEPDAFLIFKAHPDLVADARHGQLANAELKAASDLLVTDGNVLDWLEFCDEVHTMTSTVGFEALIRNVPVVTYGMPFYASWGLTADHLTCPRRQRKLTIEELVCGALIKYPRYLNPVTGEFTTALKVARLLTSDLTRNDRRSWILSAIFHIKQAWVKTARMKSRF